MVPHLLPASWWRMTHYLNQFFSPLVIHLSRLRSSNVGYKIIVSGSLKSLPKGICKASHFITGDNQVDQAWLTTLKSMLIPITFIPLYAKKYLPRVLFSKYSQGSKWDWIVLFCLFWPCVYGICFSPVTRERPLPVSLTFQRSYRGNLASQWTVATDSGGPRVTSILQLQKAKKLFWGSWFSEL